MTEEIVERTTYDDVPYESNPFPQSHPQRLASVARLFGLKPPDPASCRVLEMGCASGGNILPMACNLPDSEFVGVDLSGEQVNMARESIAELGLNNVRIENANMLDIDESWGKFDYIIAHGVFSWVPPVVQDKMLAAASENLNENGVAFISYNVYPSWHLRGMIRHMMLYHTAQFTDQTTVIQQARALINFLSDSVPTENNYYGMLLKSEMELIQKSQDYYLFHDHLEHDNIPLYFHEFAEKAEAHGLQYLGESEFSTMLTSGFSKEVTDTLKRVSRSIIQTEQYMDFVRNRMFRQTLLVHKGQPLDRSVTRERLKDFLFASNAEMGDKEHNILDSSAKVQFKRPNGPSITTNRPLTKAALLCLADAWPKALSLEELVSLTITRLEKAGLTEQPPDAALVEQILCSDLLQCLTVNLVEYMIWQADFVTEISEKPKASPMAVLQAKRTSRAVNQRHESVPLDVVLRNLLPMLDGTRDKNDLLGEMIELIRNGALTIRQNDKPLTDGKQIEAVMTRVIDNGLRNLAKNAVLIA